MGSVSCLDPKSELIIVMNLLNRRKLRVAAFTIPVSIVTRPQTGADLDAQGL